VKQGTAIWIIACLLISIGWICSATQNKQFYSQTTKQNKWEFDNFKKYAPKIKEKVLAEFYSNGPKGAVASIRAVSEKRKNVILQENKVSWLKAADKFLPNFGYIDGMQREVCGYQIKINGQLQRKFRIRSSEVWVVVLEVYRSECPSCHLLTISEKFPKKAESRFFSRMEQ